MRIVVTGRHGQVAQALLERAPALNVEVHAVARPELDLARPAEVERTLIDLHPEIIVNAAAYTAVDRAESEPDLVWRVNALGAEAIARAAKRLGIPVIQLSTDYVFGGGLDRAYREDDPTDPLGVYGDSKLGAERAVAAATGNHVILRTAWVYSPFGSNFARTILALAGHRATISVVSDQLGSPTNALDLAEGIIAIARNLLDRTLATELRGVFHITGGGDTHWAGFATAILAASAAAGGPSARVLPIATSENPTAARRPANSRLDCTKLAAIHGVSLPQWRGSLGACVTRLLTEQTG